MTAAPGSRARPLGRVFVRDVSLAHGGGGKAGVPPRLLIHSPINWTAFVSIILRASGGIWMDRFTTFIRS